MIKILFGIMIIFGLLFQNLSASELNNDTKCNKYCCKNILYFIVKECGDSGLYNVRHGGDCPILLEAIKSRVRIITSGGDCEYISCYFCNGKRLNYYKECKSLCCKRYGYVVDFGTGIIHILHCKLINKMPVYDALFKPANYDLIDGYKKMGYSGLCRSCMINYERMY